MSKTRDAARGRWPFILAQLGIDASYLRDIHGPCPVCSGKDRFRFDDIGGRGTHFCNGCGAGDGLDLVMKVFECEFKEAAAMVDAVLNGAPTDVKAVIPERPEENIEQRKADIQRVWKQASTDQTEIKRYLNGRGLRVIPPGLRYHPALEYSEKGRGYLGRFPAMLALVFGPDNKVRSIHRTYLAKVDHKKKLMRRVQPIPGSAIRLFPAERYMAVAEGIETSIAVHEITGLPVWSSASCSFMQSMELPEMVQKVAIYADNDENGKGQEAADKLARKLLNEGRDVNVYLPPVPGQDWNDFLVKDFAEFRGAV